MPWRLYMQYGDAFFSSDARLWMAVAAMFLVAGVVKGAIGLGLPTISTALLALWMPPIKAAACVKAFSEVRMKLFYSTSSPFARKVRIVTREKGLLPVVVEIECNPFANPVELRQVNRLSKVPTLLTEGLALYDSPVICEYLDSLAEHPRLVPVKGLDRWLVLRAQSLADGLLDIAVALTLEERRPEKEQSASVMKRWREQIQGALDAMHSQSAKVSRSITLGQIAFGAALGYLDFRHPEMRWREGRSALAEWFEAFAKRDSMTQTIPSDQSYR